MFITIGFTIISVLNSVTQVTDTRSDSIFKPDQVLTMVIFNTEFTKSVAHCVLTFHNSNLVLTYVYVTNDFYAIPIFPEVPQIEIKSH